MADTPVIEIRDLHKSYGNLEVLKGVDLVAPRGNVISLTPAWVARRSRSSGLSLKRKLFTAAVTAPSSTR